MQCDDLTKVNVIACDYGFTAPEFNKMLKKFSIQYKEGASWLLYKNIEEKDTHKQRHLNLLIQMEHKGNRTSMMWTQKGRLFLYEFLKAKGILPRMEEKNKYQYINNKASVKLVLFIMKIWKEE